jgi:hypothetical protein
MRANAIRASVVSSAVAVEAEDAIFARKAFFNQARIEMHSGSETDLSVGPAFGCPVIGHVVNGQEGVIIFSAARALAAVTIKAFSPRALSKQVRFAVLDFFWKVCFGYSGPVTTTSTEGTILPITRLSAAATLPSRKALFIEPTMLCALDGNRAICDIGFSPIFALLTVRTGVAGRLSATYAASLALVKSVALAMCHPCNFATQGGVTY